MSFFFRTQGMKQTRIAEHENHITTVALSPSGDFLVTGREFGAVELWDVATTKLLCELDQSDFEISSIAWSPDSKRVAVAFYRDILLFNITIPDNMLYGMINVQDFKYMIAWSPDGTMLASGGNQVQICIWDTTTCNKLATFTHYRDPGAHLTEARPERGPLSQIVWSPDSKYIVYSGFCVILRVWDVVSQTSERLGLGYEKFNSLAWSPDGRELLSVDQNYIRQIKFGCYNFKHGNPCENALKIIPSVWSSDGTMIGLGGRVNPLYTTEMNIDKTKIVPLDTQRKSMQSISSASDRNVFACAANHTIYVYTPSCPLLAFHAMFQLLHMLLSNADLDELL